MKVVTIDANTFDSFTYNNPYGTFYQTSAYGNVMSKFGLKALYLGFMQDSNLIGVTLILHKPVCLGFKYAYAPYGVLLDFNNSNLLLDAFKSLKNYLFKERFLLFKMDPNILLSIRNKKGVISWKNDYGLQIVNCLKQAGLTHCGFNSYFESVKPRWHAVLDINKDAATLFSKLDKRTRNKLRRATKFGVEVYKDNDNDVSKIYEFIKADGRYSVDYYNEFAKNFGENFEVYFAKLNTALYVEDSRRAYEKEMEINEYLNQIIQSNGYKGKNMNKILNKKMESDKLLGAYKGYLVHSTEVLKNNPDGIIIGGAIILKYKNKVHLLIEGFSKEFSKLCSSYLVKWKIIEKYANTGFVEFDMNAISGRFGKKENKYAGLNEAKFSYGSKAIEYIGEFNMVTNAPMYSVYRNLSPDNNMKNQKK